MTTHRHLTDALALAGGRAVSSGLVIGSGGNFSARLPGDEECLVTASGTWLDTLVADDFSLVGLDGTHRGGHPSPSSEVALHLAAYRARPDVTAVIHLHPQHCVLLDALGHQIRLITTDHAYYVRRSARIPWLPPGTQELADAAAEPLRDGTNCVILGHHGCSAVADSVELAYKRAANLEEAAAATYRALQLGDATAVCPPAYLAGIEQAERAGAGGH